MADPTPPLASGTFAVPAYSPAITIRKGGTALVTHFLTVLLTYLILVPESSIHGWLVSLGLSPSLATLLAPILFAAIHSFNNWSKHGAAKTDAAQ